MQDHISAMFSEQLSRMKYPIPTMGIIQHKWDMIEEVQMNLKKECQNMTMAFH